MDDLTARLLAASGANHSLYFGARNRQVRATRGRSNALRGVGSTSRRPVPGGNRDAARGRQGLRASAEEARIALASVHVSAEAIGIATFGALGIRRILAEWLASETAHDTVSDLLAPIDALGPEKAAIAI